ncbi:MAG: tRNA (adenosine(37)-N6)-dimethylallyltransferase MiaA [Lentisphaeria bacterium]|nr:tRNA (adenosine(37)-N6)-dimethylallyltransferase MiaA [Lentisphaeria bacterium]
MKAVVVTGPTATGKTRLGVSLARRFDGEIISADSRQVYTGMDIGTGKDLADFGQGRDAVPYHLIDIVSPLEEYNARRFLRDAASALQSISARGKLPVIVGGTVLYIQAFIEGYDLPGGEPDPVFRAALKDVPTAELIERLRRVSPTIFDRTDKTQRQRVIRALEIAESASAGASGRPDESAPPDLDVLVLAPYYHRQVVHQRIERRLRERLQEGLLDEVQRLHAAGVSWEKMDYFGLEYRYAARHLQGSLSEEEFFTELFTHIRRFCKSQDIWFRKMERGGRVIHWLPEGNLEKAVELTRLFLADAPLPPPELKISDIYYGPKS